MTELPGQKDRISDLWKLSDPEFFAARARLREKVECTDEIDPEWCRLVKEFADTTAELARRITSARQAS